MRHKPKEFYRIKRADGAYFAQARAHSFVTDLAGASVGVRDRGAVSREFRIETMNTTKTKTAKPETVTVRTATGRTLARVHSHNGCVAVWDDTAGHYTICHSLTPAQERYVRARVRPS